MTERRVRIFISSPGDVHDERERARGVVHQLRKTYAGRLKLQAVLWEELPLQADMKFQDGIDVVLTTAPVDIAVFILWSRLGSPTGPLMLCDDSRAYRSGTEREWDLMLKARQHCTERGEPPRPAILVYTRTDDASFEERLRGKPDERKLAEISQKRLVTEFITEEFRDAETGTNVRAYHSFDQPTTFAQRLRVHLTELLDELAGSGSSQPVWNIDTQGSPFRGLEAFEFQHAPVFFGREDEVVSLRTQLREQARRGCAFVLISGPSGSGKSSLALAGLLPDICNHELDEEIHHWRHLVLQPSRLGADLLAGLVTSLQQDGVLPELRQWSDDVFPPQNPNEFHDWITRFALRVRDALHAGGSKYGDTRLILLLDQLEELFTGCDEQSRQNLLSVLEVLARSGVVWVVATVRSDFYPDCQKLAALVRMKEGAGQFDLLPPTSDALQRLITGPAQLAGLQFEREGEKTLADQILREATEHTELLPLLEHLLHELCENRSNECTLTFAEFNLLGGLEGALRHQCEETYTRFAEEYGPAANGAFESVLAEMVSIGRGGEETFVRRTVPLQRFQQSAAQQTLVEAFITARLFTASSQSDGTQVVGVAHEALLRVWPRVTTWIERNREFLRLRAAVEHAQARWKSQEEDRSLLLSAGLSLEEGRRLLTLSSQPLRPEIVSYIQHSIDAYEQARQRDAQRRRLVMGILSLATIISVSLGLYAWHKADIATKSETKANNSALAESAARKEADEKRGEAERDRNKARAAEKLAEGRRQQAEQSAEELEATLARSNYFLAVARWNEGRASEARTLLQRIPVKHRNIEWYLDQRLFQGSFITLHGHSRGVNCAALSPGGTRIVSGSWDNTLKVWDVATGEELRTLTGHANQIYSVVFSPDGTRIVSGSADTTLKVWDTATGQELRTINGHQLGVTGVTFSPDGARLVSGSFDGTLKVWDAPTGQEIQTLSGHTGFVSSVAFSPDGTQVASSSWDNTLKMWDAVTGQELRTLTGHRSPVNSVAFSPDGTRIVSGSWDNTLKMWDAVTGQELRTLTGHRSPVNSVAFSPDGTRIVSGSGDNVLRVWNASSGQELLTLTGHTEEVNCVTFSADGTYVISASDDKTIKLWDAYIGQALRSLVGHKISVNTVAFSPDGTHLVSGSGDRTLKVWDAISGRESVILTRHSSIVTSAAFSPDGTRIVSGSWDKTLKVWDAATGKELSTLTGHTDFVTCVAFNPYGTHIVSGSRDKTLRVWDASSGRVLKVLEGHGDRVKCVAFSPDGAQIISGSEDNTLKLWDLATGQQLRTLTGHSSDVDSVAFSPNGARIVSGSGDKTLKLWDRTTGHKIRTLAGHASSVTSLVFSPDGTRIVSGSSDDTLKVWDAVTGQELRSLNGHGSSVKSVAISPNGDQIASGSSDDTLKIWDAAVGEEQWILTGHTDHVFNAAFSPDGMQIATRDSGQRVLLWDWQAGNSQEADALPDWARHSAARSPDGRWLVVPKGNDVMLVDLDYKKNPREQAYLKSKARPKPWWHVEQARAAEEANDWFTAQFHWAWAIEGSQKLGKADDERFARAQESLQAAHTKWLAELAERPEEEQPADPDQILPLVVRKHLE
ncbi:MAG: AAA family ATPase [Planctomycetaceae bacterium]